MAKKRFWLVLAGAALLALVSIASFRLYTPPGHWREGNVGSMDRLIAVAFGNGRFVALSQGRDTYLSEDGVRWRQGTQLRRATALLFAGGQFVAVGSEGFVARSEDGMAWRIDQIGPYLMYDVAYGEGLYVAVGMKGTILTSADGVTWREQATGLDPMESLIHVAHNGERFMARTSSGIVLTSPDGEGWTVQVSHLEPHGITSLAGGQGIFVAARQMEEGVGPPDSGKALYHDLFFTSQTGAEWSRQQLSYRTFCCGGAMSDSKPPDHLMVRFTGGQFVAVGGGGTIRTSADGLTWAAERSRARRTLSDVAFGNGRFVAVGERGLVLRSPPRQAAPP